MAGDMIDLRVGGGALGMSAMSSGGREVTVLRARLDLAVHPLNAEDVAALVEVPERHVVLGYSANVVTADEVGSAAIDIGLYPATDENAIEPTDADAIVAGLPVDAVDVFCAAPATPANAGTKVRSYIGAIKSAGATDLKTGLIELEFLVAILNLGSQPG